MSSVFTAEGLAAGKAAASLEKKREETKHDFLRQKQEIIESNKVEGIKDMSRFEVVDAENSAAAAAEEAFKSKTYGLVTVEKFRKAREEAAILEAQLALERAAKASEAKKGARMAGSSSSTGVKRAPVSLSFDPSDDESDEDHNAPAAKKVAPAPAKSPDASGSTILSMPSVGNDAAISGPILRKNPDVDTSFLPDAEREKKEHALRLALSREYIQKQEELKKMPLEIVYSYFDGHGHRRSITVPRGTSIGRFLEMARTSLMNDFTELKSISADSLIFVKEDMIIPGIYTFHDLINKRAMGKSGPLFDFGVKENIRFIGDVRTAKDASHPGKIVSRRWYEQNKHVFPFSRWETYDPEKSP